MNKYNADNLAELSNQLSLNDVETLLFIFSNRVSIYDTSSRVSSEIDTVCMNGASIQINLVRDDPDTKCPQCGFC